VRGTGCVVPAIVVGIVVLLLASLGSHVTTTAPSDSPATSTPASSSSEASSTRDEPAEAETTSSWNYSTGATDAMRGGTDQYAMLSSTNEVDFGFPYDSQHLNIVVRKSARGNDVLLTVEKGQFICLDFENCRFKAKFDDGPIRTFGFDEAAGGTTTAIFLRDRTSFLNALRQAHHVVIEVDFFEHTGRQFEFDPAGLEWPPKS
jgi:hypothetical protein